MIRTQQQDNAALYLRLSRDDGGDAESNSIGTQRAILQRYAAEAGLNMIGEYVDDGISGTTFERDGFKRMIADVEAGRVGTILCKDLSRLGRNNALVAYYTEIYFIENRVRFIALNDGIDTFKGDNEIMPFKSVINEYYARDISKKIRTALRANAHDGHFLGGPPPYGYMKNPEDIHRLIPNPDTMDVVKEIFRLSAEGKSTPEIARLMSASGHKIPSAYTKEKYGYTHGRNYHDDHDWSATTIRSIIINRVYTGAMVGCKYTTQSFKSKKVIVVPEEDRIVVENAHEALVRKEVFDRIQSFMTTKKRGNKSNYVNLFQGMMVCADCGGSFSLIYGDRQAEYVGYNCAKHRHAYCFNHYISIKNLQAIVLGEFQKKLAFVKAHEGELAAWAQRWGSQQSDRDTKKVRTELLRCQKRAAELGGLIKRLFEQNANGVLSDESFMELSRDYEAEKKQLSEKITELQAQYDKQNEGEQNAMRFFNLIRKYTEIDHLDVHVVRDLLDSVVIHSPSGRGKAREQKVVVRFRFIKEDWFCE